MNASERIAAELRGRIQRGELRPGDRVPSAREIARQWGVAVATATKVHAALRAAGLVEAVPGVGTRVRRRPAHPATPPPAPEPLRPDRVTVTAVAIADTEGLDGLSMRRLAAELGVGPMSLYRHVRDKDDLLLRMLDTVIREWRPPDAGGAGWRECLEAAARGLWWMFRRHPWLASALSLTRPQAIPGGLAYTEWVLAALDGLGLDLEEMFDLHLTVFGYVRGVAVSVEAEQAAVAETGLDPEQWTHAALPGLLAITEGGRYPMFARLVTEGYDFSLDRLFDRGLTLLLDGLAVRLSPAAALPSGAATAPSSPAP